MAALTLSNGTQVDPTTLDNSPFDPTVAGLAQKIKTLEGGDYQNRSGDSGSSAGAFQWNNDNKPLKPGELPSHWKNAAAQFLKDPNAPMTPENQNFVAYQQIKAYKEQGRTPTEIDALWNGAHKDETTGKYVHNNKTREQAFVGGSTSPNTSPTPNNQGFITSAEIPDAPTDSSTQQTGSLGTNPNDSLYGKILDNSITRGIENVGNVLSFGGAKQLGNEAGLGLAKLDEYGKGILGGENNSQYVESPNIGDTAAGAAKTVAGVTSLASGSLLKMFKEGQIAKSVFSSPEAQTVLKDFLGPGEKLSNLSIPQKYDIVSEALSQENISPGLRKLLEVELENAGKVMAVLHNSVVPIAQSGGLFGKLLKAVGIGSLTSPLWKPILNAALGQDNASTVQSGVSTAKNIVGALTK